MAPPLAVEVVRDEAGFAALAAECGADEVAVLTACHDPAARRWLWAHWGTTQPLRRVQVLEGEGDRRLRRSARVAFEFVSADWTPWPAIRRLRRDWPRLAFDVRPDYGRG